jgi:hypothetical protein
MAFYLDLATKNEAPPNELVLMGAIRASVDLAAGVAAIATGVYRFKKRTAWTQEQMMLAQGILDGTAIASIAVGKAAVLEQAAQRDADSKMIKAAVLTALWGRLGRQPTVQEILAERNRFIAIYEAL